MPEPRRKTLSEILHQARLAVTLVLGGLLGVFALQNMAKVELTFLFWTFESRGILVIAWLRLGRDTVGKALDRHRLPGRGLRHLVAL